MSAAMLFDFGGTLDADGVHWLDRFLAVYDRAAPGLRPRAAIRAAFDAVVAALATEADIGQCGFRELVRRHVAGQCRRLGIADPRLEALLARSFIEPAERHLARNCVLLAGLRRDGWRLALVSNFYGNLQTVCEESGLASLFDVVLDSALVGLRKPDPRFFTLALDRLGVEAHGAVFVGDSLDRDVRPARSVGMTTVWLCDDLEDRAAGGGLADVTIRELPELPGALVAYEAAEGLR